MIKTAIYDKIKRIDIKPFNPTTNSLKYTMAKEDNKTVYSWRLLSLSLMAIWTLIIAASLAWNLFEVKERVLETARTQMEMAYTKNIIYRRWNTEHGGVYVEVTEEVRPNPYMSNIAERDIVTPSGKLLTLINPALMMREVSAITMAEHDISERLVSLAPLNPDNRADPWETEALRSFESGGAGARMVTEIAGVEKMRLIRPLKTERSCLRCHSGYAEGDVQGAISIMLPMAPIWSAARSSFRALVTAHILLWLLGSGAILLVTMRLKRNEALRMRMAEELLKERNKQETIIESMGDGLDIVDKDFKIQFMNKNLLKLFGAEAVGKTCYEIYTGRTNPCDECPVVKGIEETGVLEISALQGKTFLVTHSPFKNPDGTVSIMEIFKDITERKELEQKLLIAERFTALNHFCSTLAHDLRNPIIGIKKRLEGLQITLDTSDLGTTKRVLADLVSGSELLMGMVNDVMDVYQDSYEELPLIICSFPLLEAMEEAINLLQIEAEEKKVRITLNGKENPIAIHGDKRRLQRVFINLLDNAIKYSPVGGSVEITFEAVTEDGDDYLLFKIEDEGPGIPAAELSKIFEPFHKKGIKEEGMTGTGLGLYFCKVVTEAHGGSIWAEEREGTGAAFYIKTPIREEPYGDKDTDSR
jgi:signal transduction histidine kinase